MITDNLSHEDALLKMRDLIETIKIAMLITRLDTLPLSVNPMETRSIDKEGNIWFLSGLDSDHNKNIQNDNRIHIVYSHPREMLFLSVYGTASIITDTRIITSLYTLQDDNWFQGNNDPNLSAIKFVPTDAFYWDKKSNKFIQFIRKGTEAITGMEGDAETKGKLDI